MPVKAMIVVRSIFFILFCFYSYGSVNPFVCTVHPFETNVDTAASDADVLTSFVPSNSIVVFKNGPFANEFSALLTCVELMLLSCNRQLVPKSNAAQEVTESKSKEMLLQISKVRFVNADQLLTSPVKELL